MDLGHIARRIAGRSNSLGDSGSSRLGSSARLVRLRITLGPRALDESGSGSAASILARLGRAPFASQRRSRLEASAPRGSSRGGLLLPVDDPELRRVPPADPAAFKSAVRIVARQQ